MKKRTNLTFFIIMMATTVSLTYAQLWEKISSTTTLRPIESRTSKTELIRNKLLQILKKRLNMNSQRNLFRGDDNPIISSRNDNIEEKKQKLLMETIRNMETQMQQAKSERKESERDIKNMKDTLEREKQDLELLNRKREIVTKALMKQAEIAQTKRNIIQEALKRRNKVKKETERIKEEMLLMQQMELHRRKEKELDKIRKLNLIKKEKQEEIRALQAHKLLAKESNERVIQKINDLKTMNFLGDDQEVLDFRNIQPQVKTNDIEAILALISDERRTRTTTLPPKKLTERERQSLLTLLDLRKNALVLTKNNKKIAEKFKTENALFLSSIDNVDDGDLKNEKLEFSSIDDYDYDEYKEYDYDYQDEEGIEFDYSPDYVPKVLRNHPPNLLAKQKNRIKHRKSPLVTQTPHIKYLPRPIVYAQPPNLLQKQPQPLRYSLNKHNQDYNHYNKEDFYDFNNDFSMEADKFFREASISRNKIHNKIQKELNLTPTKKQGRNKGRRRRKGTKRTNKNVKEEVPHSTKKLSFSDIMSDFLDKNPIPFDLN
ncbi:uncharacterized protein [Lepeophtheirus salmonis]|uniref:uncharacterized protein n=1 Tax=Lepeophtheirus salmonis TaxID=72036 RepID=UPI001AE8E0AD|nr:thyroid receptor-interacting protein 11-like [Lepeophtheirus salmonis]